MKEIKAFLLGKSRVLLNGEAIALPFKQAQALLYYLLVEGSAPRLKLADLLWGDRGDERKVRSNMRNAIYVLRKALGADFIQETQKNIISINPEYHVQVDLLSFLKNETSLEEYQGDFLEDFYLKDNECFNEWVLGIRQYYNRVCLERLKREIDESFDEQNWGCCESRCLQLLKLDEYDESVYCRLMEIYRMQGEYSKATALYERLQKLFSEELFQSPGQEATSLMEEIKQLRNQRVTQLIAQKNSAEQLWAERHPFFGRAAEQKQLADALKEFEHGGGQKSLAVLGETGIGKTCLVEAVIRQMEREDGASGYFQTRCYRAEEQYALKPWQNIFTQLISYFDASLNLEDSAPFIEAVSNVFPFLRPREGVQPMEQDEIAVVQYNNSERVIAQTLIQLAKKQKLVLFFDDLQWADNITISLIQDIMTSEQNQNILFLFACEEDKRPFVDGFLENMTVSGLLKKVELGRFSFEETIEMANLIVPSGLESEEMKKRFYRETDGNPFFIIETANSIRHNRSMADITPNIRDSIYARIMLLSPECRNILNLISIFFDGVSFELLLELSNREEYELVEILETLIARQLIWESTQPDGVKFQFVHQKTREYVYGELSITKKQLLHEKTARCLERKLKNSDSDLRLYSSLIYHFQRSRQQKEYLKYYIEYVYSYLNRSHEYYPIIVNYVSKPADDTPEIDGSDNEGIARILKDIKGLVGENIDDFDDEDCQGCLSDYYHMMGRYYIRQVEYEKGLFYINKLIALNQGLDSIQCCKNMIKANRQLICVYLDRYDTENMRRVIQESLQLMQRIYKAEEEAIWMRLSGLCSIMSGEIEQGIDELKHAISTFENSDEKERYLYNLAASYAWLGEAERCQMNYREAKSYYDKAISICTSHFLVGGTATFYTYAGQAAFDSGDLLSAQEYLSNAVRQFSAVELMWGRGVAFGYYGMLCIRQGDYPSAFDYLTKAECFAQRLESSYEQGMLNRMYAQIVLQMEHDLKLRSVFGQYLNQTAEIYAARARKLLENVYSPVDMLYLDQVSRGIYR